MRTGLLLTVFAFLATVPVLAQAPAPVKAPNIVAVVPPPLSSVPSSSVGCTPINPCAVFTPALGDVTMPAPDVVPQPDLPATAAAPAARPPSGPATAAGPAVQCPPMPGARGAFAGRGAGRGGEGRGAFAGRGEGRGAFSGRGEGRGTFAGRGQFGGRGAIPPECLPAQAGRGNPPAGGPR